MLYLLLTMGIIELPAPPTEQEREAANYSEMIHLYMDLLKILESNFQKEIGREFENIFVKCKDELTGQAKMIFHGFDLAGDAQDALIKKIAAEFSGMGKAAEGRLALLTSFNKLIYLLIMRMKKVLGRGLTEKTIMEMMNILDYVEKYRQDTEMMNYVKGNLMDYMNQIKS
ncbi:MAG: hypothetical protein JRJ85_24220 [Deltaproteobacteria bacterium]|nr:hypothetical protein [Deltaproteobacteria bacterium]